MCTAFSSLTANGFRSVRNLVPDLSYRTWTPTFSRGKGCVDMCSLFNTSVTQTMPSASKPEQTSIALLTQLCLHLTSSQAHSSLIMTKINLADFSNWLCKGFTGLFPGMLNDLSSCYTILFMTGISLVSLWHCHEISRSLVPTMATFLTLHISPFS